MNTNSRVPDNGGHYEPLPPLLYVPENPDYNIVDSLRDSIRFVRKHGLSTWKGNVCGRSSFVNDAGEIMEWHDFGCIEGPGWAANSAGAAKELMECGRLFGDGELFNLGKSLLKHSLEGGFMDWDKGLVRGYRDIRDNRFYLNYLHNEDADVWLCPGSMAYIGVQLLEAGDVSEDDELNKETIKAARLIGEWIARHVKLLPSGWMPRRCGTTGNPYPFDAWGRHQDAIFEISGDGIFAVRLFVELTRRGIADHAELAKALIRAHRNAGGFFGSINHDTYDTNENVAYSTAFRTLMRAAEFFDDEDLRYYAFEQCLAPLRHFELHENHNGVDCAGLLWMEKTWTTAYFWENAEAAWAYFEAFEYTGELEHVATALTILRSVARHHHGPDGFLTEGCDWNAHLPQYLWMDGGRLRVAVHYDNAAHGDILYTEPLLNNLHIAAPTCYYLNNLAIRELHGPDLCLYDHEENLLFTRPFGV